MKKFLLILLFGSLCTASQAVVYTPFSSTDAASVAMPSVNNSGYMYSGSTYSPTVYEVGAYSPSKAAGPRKSPPGKDDTGYDPTNPQFAPLGDALIPLLLMVMAYATCLLLRRRKSRV